MNTQCVSGARSNAAGAWQRPGRAWAGLMLGVALAALAPSRTAQAAPAPAATLAEIEGKLRGRPDLAADALQAAALAAPVASPAQVEALLARGAMLVRLGDAYGVEQLARELEQATPAGSAVRPPLAAAAAAMLRGQWLHRHGSLGRADRLLAEATARLATDTPPTLRLRFTTVHAKIKESMGKLDDAVRLGQQAVVLADRCAPAWRRAEQRSALAYSLFHAQQKTSAQQVNKEALALATEAGDPVALAKVLTTAAILLSADNLPEEELRLMQAVIKHTRQAGAKRDEVAGLANLADHYLKHGDYATALQLSLQALPLAREVRDPITETVALTNAGLARISMGQRDEGIQGVREALVIEERAGGLTAMSQIQNELGLYLEKAGFLPEAWAAFVEHRRLADEVFQRQHQQAVLETQEAFESDQRQRELALMSTEKSLAEAQLEGRKLQQRLWAMAAMAAVLLLAVVAVLLSRMRRSNAALRSTNAQLQVASERDPLTGLANRRHFQQVMKQHAAGDGMLEGSLLLIDIDHFKRINDSHGHATGDAVLVELAQRLRGALREPDLCVRWGGEEFLIVVRSLPADQVEALAQRLLAVIGAEPVRHGRQLIAVTASIGFATFPLGPLRQRLTWERAVDLVDTAMYLAKAHGRNRAYGVRALQGDDALVAHPQARTLESAWREGRADLTQLAGPGQAMAAA